jgi:hypothetical protein
VRLRAGPSGATLVLACAETAHLTLHTDMWTEPAQSAESKDAVNPSSRDVGYSA